MKRIGLIGVGAIAQSYMKALEAADFARIVAVADVRQEAAEAAAEALHGRAFTSHEAMSRQEGLDAVVICTPPNTHPDIAIHFLDRHIPVLCEKPLAVDERSAARILAAGRRNQTLVTMASKFRYVEDVIRARALITSGALGEIRLMENAFCAPVDMSKRWNSNPELSGGGVLIDNGTHSVDIVRYLLGPIERVLAVSSTLTPSLGVEDNVQLMARTAGGTDVHIDLSWTFDKQLSNFIGLYGTLGNAHIGWKESRYKLHGSNTWMPLGKGYDKFAAFRGNVRNLCAAIDGSEAPLIDAADAMASVQVIRAAYTSIASGGWVEVAENLARNPEHITTITSEAAE